MAKRKFKVVHQYAIKVFETHEVWIDDDLTDDDREAMGLTDHDCPIEFFKDEENTIEYLSTETLIDKTEGDCVGDFYNFEIEEINVLDQIVEAVAEPDKCDK